MRLVLTGGGTGGHIYPALAIGREAAEQEPGSELLYIGAARGMESRIVPAQGVPFESIDISGFRRSLSLENFRTIARFLRGVRRSKALLKQFKPDIVVGTGGYVCGPVVYAASKLGIPTLIHEQNVVPGLTNKFLSRYASAVAVSFADSLPHFAGHRNVLHAGNPVASAVRKADKSKGFASLGLAPGTPYILVTGGSGGAQALNEATLAMLPGLLKQPELSGVHLVLVTGERYYERTSERLGTLPPDAAKRVHVLRYVNNMPEVLAASAMIVSRAGASFLAEVTSLGVPAVLVPSPNVTNNHQQPNAESLANAGAGRMILEKDLSGDTLLAAVSAIMKDAALRGRMTEASRGLGMPKAAEAIYGQMLQAIKRR